MKPAPVYASDYHAAAHDPRCATTYSGNPCSCGATQSSDMDNLVRLTGAWANATFASDGAYRGPSIVAHLRREVEELAADPRDMEEVADCFLLLAHLAHQNGGSLFEAACVKFAKNKARKWGKPDAEGVVEHVREVKK